jgi:2,4-dienoyl-CoA reductase (NADPH2)
VTSGMQPISASALTKAELPKPQYEEPRALTVPEIAKIVDKFGTAAFRCQQVGYDGIELNGATTHLLNSFLSRAWNKRHDEYGCDTLENRARIVVEIIREIKKRTSLAVTALFNGAEFGLKDGIAPEEAAEFAKLFEAAGADAIFPRVEFYRPFFDSTHFPDVYVYPEPLPNLHPLFDASHHGLGGEIPLAAFIKKGVSIPVIASGGIDPVMGERALRSGQVDFVSMNRRLLADPQLPNKIASGHPEDVRPCTSCMTCFAIGETGKTVKCRINAALGKSTLAELTADTKPASVKKRVMVVGSGPAGMEAARVAAQRGHAVSLYEQEGRMGGSLPMAAMVKGFEKEAILPWVEYLKTQVKKLNVEIHLNTNVDRSLVERVKPDVLIVAAGGVDATPDIPGINNSKLVVTGQELHQKLSFFLRFAGPKLLRYLTNFYMPVGKRVVIIGGGAHGCQTAELLVKRGRKVTIVDTENELGEGLVQEFLKPSLLKWLADKGVTLMPGVKYEEITSKGLTITTKEGARQTIEADTIVTALPMLPNDGARDLETAAAEVHVIGDCREPGWMIDAVADGWTIGCSI